MTALEVADVRFAYGRTPVIDGISLSVDPGSTLAVLGPNGAGKSTLISLCIGLHRPASGTVRIFGADPHTDPAATAARTGVMLQDGGLPMAAKPHAVLRHLAKMYAEPASAEELMEQLGINSFSRRPIRRLSGGQRQRVALAAALIGRPQLVFLDEPTAGLDPQAALAVKDIVGELKSAGTAVVLTTHNMDDAQELADDVCIVDHGRVIASGTPAALTAEGASVLSLEFAHPIDERLSAELSARWGLSPTAPTALTAAGEFTAGELSALTACIDAAGADLRTVSMSSGSLGDVFLQLTGRSLR